MVEMSFISGLTIVYIIAKNSLFGNYLPQKILVVQCESSIMNTSEYQHLSGGQKMKSYKFRIISTLISLVVALELSGCGDVPVSPDATATAPVSPDATATAPARQKYLLDVPSILKTYGLLRPGYYGEPVPYSKIYNYNDVEFLHRADANGIPTVVFRVWETDEYGIFRHGAYLLTCEHISPMQVQSWLDRAEKELLTFGSNRSFHYYSDRITLQPNYSIEDARRFLDDHVEHLRTFKGEGALWLFDIRLDQDEH